MKEPPQLRERPHWGRFPIPFVTVVDERGRPDFRAHDDDKRFECALNRLCQLCGKPLILEPIVFVTLNPRRLVFGEPPMHESCFEYAWMICPWLAGAGWSDRWRGEARDLEILPPPAEAGELTVLWVNDSSSWTCVSDPQRPGGWLWEILASTSRLPDLVGPVGAPLAYPVVVWAESRPRDQHP